MEFSSCPLCQLTLPSAEIERHANGHFADEDYAADFEIAQQIALAPASPPRYAEDTLQLVCSSLDHGQSSTSSGCLTCCGRNLDEKCATLVHSQKMELFYNVEGGLMLLLKSCLELDRENSVSILSGHVDHIQSSESEDVGWGCGWRNIQMLCSHLLSQRQQASDVLFGGSGFIPDIASLQRWLELAWEKGFDAPGSDDFDKKVYGKCDWIGTTECAALLRSFGLRAGIVDFCDKDLWLDSSSRSTTGIRGTNKSVDKRTYAQVYGPMDIFLSEGKLGSALSVNSMNGLSVNSMNGNTKHFDVSSHKVIEWVWNYFSGDMVNKPGNLSVILSEKAPLYFQHHGHSRTIVGIQATQQRTGLQRYNLLIFDPAEQTIIAPNLLPMDPDSLMPVFKSMGKSKICGICLPLYFWHRISHECLLLINGTCHENQSTGKISQSESWMAKIDKERSPHFKEAAVPVLEIPKKHDGAFRLCIWCTC